MDIWNIFILGCATGILLSIISMILISARNSEIYPVGGFIPSLWMVSDLGVSSQIVVAGILIMGGMTGFYLTLTFWKERTLFSINYENSELSHDNTPKEKINNSGTVTTVKGKSLAEFL